MRAYSLDLRKIIEAVERVTTKSEIVIVKTIGGFVAQKTSRRGRPVQEARGTEVVNLLTGKPVDSDCQ
jgi:hypothetical protein